MQPANEVYLNSYKFFRGTPVGPINAQALAVLKAEAKNKTSNVDLENTANLMNKIAKQVDSEEWVAFCKSGEMPPLKLTAAEMEMVRGGTILDAFAIVATVAAAVGAMKLVW